MTGKNRPALVRELAKGSEAYAAASDPLQDAIAEMLDKHGKDGVVVIYPAKHAWIDGVERITQTVPLATAAGYLAHVPPPFYLDRATWDAQALFCDPPFFRETETPPAEPVRAPEFDPFAKDAPAAEIPAPPADA